MNRTICLCFLAAFLLLCMIPSVGVLILGPSGPAANELQAPVPRLTKLDGAFNPDFLSEASDWFADRFAFRRELSTGWSGLNANILRSSVNKDVILGRDGWLFFADSAEDYCGEVLPDDVIDRIAERLAELSSFCQSCGAEFIFTVAPNKNSVYPQFMPVRYPASEDSDGSNVSRLYRRLEELGVRYTDLHAAFAEEEELLYFRTDSHWNAKGAALAADRILTASGRTSAFYDGSFRPGASHEGDLYAMLYPSGTVTEPDPEYVPGFRFTCQEDARGGEAIEFRTENPSGTGRLLCCRDSFGNSLYPYLAESFASAVFCRSSEPDPGKIMDGAFDTVIFEIVERNISWLAPETE